MCHAYYQQRGGEDGSFEAERDMLRSNGHEVIEYVRRNSDFARAPRTSQAVATVWNRHVAIELGKLVDDTRPDVVHFQNTFPAISPAAFRSVASRSVAVVETLRNFRIGCLSGVLFRDGEVCELCWGRGVAWAGIRHKCFHDSAAASSVVAAMDGLHRLAGTWSRDVHRYIVLSEFARSKLGQALPPDRLAVKPNFLSQDPGAGPGGGGYALFVGRLDAPKGVTPLAAHWAEHGPFPLWIVGDGPERDKIQAVAARSRHVNWLGQVPPGRVVEIMSEASVLIFPSRWYEGMPRTIIESLAVGTPIVASRLGTMPEMVDESVGDVVPAGDHEAFVRGAARVSQQPDLRVRARARFLDRYTMERNLPQLLDIYRSAQRVVQAEPS